MHALALVVGAPPAVVDGIVQRHRNVGRAVAVEARSDPSAALITVGEHGSVLATWIARSGPVAAFGSSVEHLSLGELQRELARAEKEGRISTRASDLVAISLHDDGSATAFSGGGFHRLHRRRLPGGGLLISSHLATAVAAGSAASVDRRLEDFLLGFGFLPDGRTPFEGVDILPPATVWRTTESSPRSLELDRSAFEPEEYTGSTLLDLLLSAVDRRAAGRDHHAVFLGGFDSALVCALLRRLGKGVTTFTFDVGDERLNQSNVDLVQKSLDLEHVWVPITPDRMRGAFEVLTDRVNSPGAQPHYQLHTVLGSEDIQKRGFPLVFTGDGCDAAFLGYPTVNRRGQLTTSLRRLPSTASRSVLGLLGLPPVERRLGHVARVGRSALRAAMLPWPAAGHLPTQYLDEISLRRLRLDPPPVQDETVEELRLRLANGLEDIDPTLLAYIGNAATGASRIKVDGALMHTGIAQYTPFNDSALREYVRQLPVEALRPPKSRYGSLGKEILIDEVLNHELLPREIVLQPKASPSTSPIDTWYMNELRPVVFELLEGLPFRWNRNYVEELLAPKMVETWYRRRVALSPHALQAIGLLVSYGAFAGLSR